MVEFGVPLKVVISLSWYMVISLSWYSMCIIREGLYDEPSGKDLKQTHPPNPK